MCWMFKWAVGKAFSLSLSSLTLFSASSNSQFSKGCRIGVLHQMMVRTQPSISAALPGVMASDDTETGAVKTFPFQLSITCSSVFSWGSYSEPQESEHTWIIIKYLQISILKGTSEFGDWKPICKRIIRYRKTAPSTRLWCPCMHGQKSTPHSTVVICNDGIVVIILGISIP